MIYEELLEGWKEGQVTTLELLETLQVAVVRMWLQLRTVEETLKEVMRG